MPKRSHLARFIGGYEGAVPTEGLRQLWQRLHEDPRGELDPRLEFEQIVASLDTLPDQAAELDEAIARIEGRSPAARRRKERRLRRDEQQRQEEIRREEQLRREEDFALRAATHGEWLDWGFDVRGAGMFKRVHGQLVGHYDPDEVVPSVRPALRVSRCVKRHEGWSTLVTRRAVPAPEHLTLTVASLLDAAVQGKKENAVLPILADALEDAGYRCAVVLTHLRLIPHRRAPCWAAVALRTLIEVRFGSWAAARAAGFSRFVPKRTPGRIAWVTEGRNPWATWFFAD